MIENFPEIAIANAITASMLLGLFHRVEFAPIEAAGILDMAEDVAITRMVETEKLARDVYDYQYKTWKMPLFSNISALEQNHMNALSDLITRWGLPDPVSNTAGVFNNPILQQLYYDLNTQGKRSKVDAVQVGGYIEELDILDLWDSLDNTSDANIVSVFTYLVIGSYNHLHAFASTYTRITGKAYVPQLLPREEYDDIISGIIEQPGGFCWRRCL